ncbi:MULTISPECIES: hypothetical protein [unclassified Streptomyces]|uniref:hypothetical protein n=1 Tax=unclassified Streptomyces TaxID=2593676 RepID=UPI00336A2373
MAEPFRSRLLPAQGPTATGATEHPTVRRAKWLRVYRNTWGFVSLVLRRTPDSA